MNETGKNALVTGGSRGIGSGIVRRLAKAGYNVFFTYCSSQEDAEAVRTDAESMGVRCGYVQAELSGVGVPQWVVNQAAEFLGGLSLVVNNAGITEFQSVLDITEDIMDDLIGVDFRGYLLTSKYAARYMVEHNIPGSIICVTSSRGQRAYPGDAVYGGIKAAIERACQSMALDLAPYGIRVNCVAPGAVCVREGKAFYDQLGPRIPLGRIGTPVDVAGAVAFLASDEAGYVTGATIRVDGGLSLPGMPEGRPREGYEDRGWGAYPKR